MFGKRNVATVVAEFLGTGVLTLLILSVQRSQLSLPFFVAAAGGLAMAVMVFTLPRATAGFFNPAITVAFWIARRIPTISAILFVLAQILGAWGAYYLFTYFVKNPLMPVGGKFNWHIFAAEAVGSGIFGLGIAAAVYQRASTAATAAFAGLSLMIGMIAASSASLALLNPAVALGVRAVVWGTYIAGPLVGAIVGVNLYALIFAEREKVIVVPARKSTVIAPAATVAVTKKKVVKNKKKTTRTKK